MLNPVLSERAVKLVALITLKSQYRGFGYFYKRIPLAKRSIDMRMALSSGKLQDPNQL